MTQVTGEQSQAELRRESGIEELLDEIAASDAGPDVAAFFDYDGTLIAGYSANAFWNERLRRWDMSVPEMVRASLAGLEMRARGGDVGRLMEIAADAWGGRREQELLRLGERVYRRELRALVYPEARELVDAHLARGHTVAIATSAFRYQVQAAADDFGIEHVLCTRTGVAGGVLTGTIDGDILWGPGKERAVQAFAATRGLDLDRAFGYANGAEDVPFLSTLGRPRAVNPHRDLQIAAARLTWPAVTFPHCGQLGWVPVPVIEPLVRTGIALTGTSAVMLGTGALMAGAGVTRSLLRAAARLALAVPEPHARISDVGPAS